MVRRGKSSDEDVNLNYRLSAPYFVVRNKTIYFKINESKLLTNYYI